MLLSALLFASSATLPSVDDIRGAVPSSVSSCVMFMDGVCICTDFAAETVEAMTCVEDEATGEFTCSYNILFVDHSGLEGKHWEQRTDVFRYMDSGKLQRVAAATEPVIYESFGPQKNLFAASTKAKNPRRSLRRY